MNRDSVLANDLPENYFQLLQEEEDYCFFNGLRFNEKVNLIAAFDWEASSMGEKFWRNAWIAIAWMRRMN